MGHMSTRGRVIGHIGDGAHGQLDTVDVFSEYIH